MAELCTHVREQLSSYLDGELVGDRGTLVRTHLRECAACRAVSVDEAALRDGLRTLPPLDPPAHLWANVRAQLEAAEAVEAKRPSWRRLLARAGDAFARNLRPIAVGTALAAAAVTLVAWRAHRDAADGLGDGSAIASVPAPIKAPVATATDTVDVTADLARESARVGSEYATAAAEVLALATTARAQWSDTKRASFDARLVELRTAIADAPDARATRRGWRSLIRYVQTSVARDDLALADTGGTP